MKEYLENLKNEQGEAVLSTEQIKGILAENGKIVQNEKDKITNSTKDEIQSYKDQVASLNDQISKLPSSAEVENLNNQIKEFQEKETQRQEADKKAKEESIRNERTNAFFNDVKFSSNAAKEGIISAFNKMDFKYDEESKKFIGGNEWLEDMKKNDAGSFMSDIANPKYTTSTSALTEGNSLDSIMKAMGLSTAKK